MQMHFIISCMRRNRFLFRPPPASEKERQAHMCRPCESEAYKRGRIKNTKNNKFGFGGIKRPF